MKTNSQKYASLEGNFLMLGFGSIVQAVLPLLFRHLGIKPGQVRIVSRHADKSSIAAEFGVEFIARPVTEGLAAEWPFLRWRL